jgi:hypothetical protein
MREPRSRLRMRINESSSTRQRGSAMKPCVVTNTVRAATKRPVALVAIDPRTAAARQATGLLLQASGLAPVKCPTFNSAV